MSRPIAPVLQPRWWRPVLLTVLLGIGLPSVARAVTADEIIALSRAGLGDAVLIALVQSTGTTTPVDAELVARLAREGVSEPVVIALIRAGAGSRPAEPAPPLVSAAVPAVPASDALTWTNNVAVIGARPQVPVLEQPIIVVPWVVGVGHAGRKARSEPYLPGYRGFGRFINDGFIDGRHRPDRRRRP